MRSSIKYKCRNYLCEKYNIEVNYSDHELFLDDKRCEVCYQHVEFDIKHGLKEFHSVEALINYLNALKTELELLNRLKKANACSDEELIRINEIFELLDKAECPCCGQLIMRS